MSDIAPDSGSDDRRRPAINIGRHVQMRLVPQPDSVPAARHAVAALVEDEAVDPDRRHEVVLAVSEAVSNAVLHAYDSPDDGLIDLFAMYAGDELILTVSDTGRGLDRPSRRPGMGAGLHLIRDAADQALIAARPGGGTSVQCRFALRDRAPGMGSLA